MCVFLTVFTVTLGAAASRGAEPLLQVKVRKEPRAVQLSTSVLLISMTSARLDLIVTSDTGSAGEGGTTPWSGHTLTYTHTHTHWPHPPSQSKAKSQSESRISISAELR